MTAPSTDGAAVRQIIRAVKAAGWVLSHVWDGEEETPVASETGALALVMDLDESVLHFTKRTGPLTERGYVYFVLGNEPFEVAADYTVNLEGALAPLFDRWEDQ